jgi:hypothetical protein
MSMKRGLAPQAGAKARDVVARPGATEPRHSSIDPSRGEAPKASPLLLMQKTLDPSMGWPYMLPRGYP